jgi:hypothetical protein
LELLLSLSLKWANDSKVSLLRALEVLTSQPAKVLGKLTGMPSDLNDSLGQLRVGGVADLVVFDPRAEWQVTPDALHSQGKHTPFALILSGAGRYAKDPNRLDAFTAHPATWLNAHRWLDDALPERVKTVEEKKAEELRLSKEKELREQEASRNYFAEQEAARARAVPMPEELRSILRKM